MKRLLTIIAFLSISALSYSQVAIGVKVANPLTAVNVMKNQTANTPKRIRNGGGILGEFYMGAINVGAFMRVPLKTHWALQTEVLYKREGVWFFHQEETVEEETALFIDHGTYDFWYAEVPILLQWEGKRTVRGFAQLGVSPKFLTSAKYSAVLERGYHNVISSFNTVVLNFNIGGGVLWNRRDWVFTLDGRLSTNLTPLTSEKNTPDIDFSKVRNYYFAMSLGAGYKPFKKKDRLNPPTEEVVPAIPTDRYCAQNLTFGVLFSKTI
ncbi:hypothetical protein RCZ04_03100 [Capnocytophaga sp. HP1101]